MNDLDIHDFKILQALQKNSNISTQDLADQVNLSKTPCWRRVRKLEELGYIKKYVALLDHKKLALSVMAYVQVSMLNHDLNTLRTFDAFVEQSPYILDCNSTAGNFDYVMKVIAKDTEQLESFLMRDLLSVGVVQSTNTNLILRQKKSTTELPL
ncbi:Lrp/AsnC family transcriptional regulator [Marinicella litoralis]|uniref:AsnC family transcriptional regulator n=1 Tax=Marinicella litoralis TaxID=644220 RepID=A0A4R6XJF7_9GAMM|nr:Lrp/AsnC family transcriptional regulator [Marinicella litoralis]TDR17557.1 AsnC family transcriptional regulator [Marinicella litoralis]